jgi:hypothetical protein
MSHRHHFLRVELSFIVKAEIFGERFEISIVSVIVPEFHKADRETVEAACEMFYYWSHFLSTSKSLMPAFRPFSCSVALVWLTF